MAARATYFQEVAYFQGAPTFMFNILFSALAEFKSMIEHILYTYGLESFFASTLHNITGGLSLETLPLFFMLLDDEASLSATTACYNYSKSNIISHPALKDRISRCAKSCQDKIQDKVSVNTTQNEASKLQEEMNTCVDQCCDTHRELLPRMFERMSETLSQLQHAPST